MGYWDDEYDDNNFWDYARKCDQERWESYQKQQKDRYEISYDKMYDITNLVNYDFWWGDQD